jgi:hypothetical protein
VYYKLLLLSSFLFLLTACPICREETVEKDLGELPENILDLVPYQDEETYHLIHSAGQVINYSSTRETTDYQYFCEHCCKYTYITDRNTATMTPDYPIFTIKTEIGCTGEDKLGQISYYIYLELVDLAYSYIPTSLDTFHEDILVDSLVQDGVIYQNVYKLKLNNYNTSGDITADSLYYNYEKGIIKIKMTNDETYKIQE